MKRAAELALEDSVAEEAILWMVRLQSGEVDAGERRAFEAWLALNPEHAAAMRRIHNGLGSTQVSLWRGRSSTPILKAINAPSGRRAFLRNSLMLGGLALSIGLVGRNEGFAWLSGADLVTGTAERRNWQLDDGSHLQLNARSKVSATFANHQRRLQLHEGELLLDVARQGTAPLTLRTAQGVIESHGGRLMVRQADDSTRLTTLDGALSLTPQRGVTVRVEARRSIVFDEHLIVEQHPMMKSETAWLDGWLEARNQPLFEVVETIRTYRRGIVRLDSNLTQLPVSGLFPLDNSDQTLEMLEQLLPIRVRRFSPYWISIEHV